MPFIFALIFTMLLSIRFNKFVYLALCIEICCDGASSMIHSSTCKAPGPGVYMHGCIADIEK